jgi:hypothetical protein
MGEFASAPSASEDEVNENNSLTEDNKTLDADAKQTQNRDADANRSDAEPYRLHTVRTNPLKNNDADGADDADANCGTYLDAARDINLPRGAKARRGAKGGKAP